MNAIADNNLVAVESELKKKSKLEEDELTTLFSTNYAPILTKEMVELLYKNKSFPEDISLTTIKCHLFIHCNPCFSAADFIDKPDLILDRCSIGSPMLLLSRFYINASFVELLIKKGVNERPIFLFGMYEESYFQHIDLLDIKDYRERLKKIFGGETEGLFKSIFNKSDIMSMTPRCKIIELFLKHPTKNLDILIKDELSSPSLLRQLRLLPFFAWTAVNNRVDLFENTYFKMIVSKCPEPMKQVAKIAAVFDAPEYIEKIISMLDITTIKIILAIAAVSHNQKLLINIFDMLKKSGITLKDISPKIKIRGDHKYGSIGDDEFLFWAIRSNNVEAVNYLLESGIAPDNYIMAFGGCGHLETAVKMGNISVIKLLLEYKSDPTYKNDAKRTALHRACESQQWDIAELLISKKANLYDVDEDKIKPIDFIKDESIKRHLLFIKEKKCDSLKEHTYDSLPVKLFASKAPLFSHNENENKEKLAREEKYQSEVDKLFGTESAGFVEIGTMCRIL